MTKRNISKLFAVAVFATTAPALASTDNRPASQRQQAVAKPMAPRTLPNRRPACGNTMGKSERPASCDSPVAPPPPATTVVEPPRTVVVVTPVQLAYTARRVLKLLGITTKTRDIEPVRPRELRDGKPANGNIPSRRSSSVPRREPEPRNPDEN